jgi:S1-C subfamily serine protease
LVGLNTFIFTKSGGNEGVGFAIPANLVNAICRQIRIDHHVHHHQIGISVRAITPSLAQALHLPIQDGVVIEDVAPESPAAIAGLVPGDVIVAVHGQAIQDIRQLALYMYSYAVGDLAEVDVLRGSQKLQFRVGVFERPTGPERFEDLVSGDANPLPRIDILVVAIDDQIASLMPPQRIPGGVLVAAKMADARPRLGDQLAAGDIIHALNGTPISDLNGLRNLLESLKADSPLVIQVERAGLLRLIVLEGD